MRRGTAVGGRHYRTALSGTRYGTDVNEKNFHADEIGIFSGGRV